MSYRKNKKAYFKAHKNENTTTKTYRMYLNESYDENVWH